MSTAVTANRVTEASVAAKGLATAERERAPAPWYTQPVASVGEELRIECEVMIKYALASGLRLPPEAINVLHILSDQPRPLPGEASSADQRPANDEALRALAQAHEQLALVVAPATPRTLLYVTSVRRDGWLKFLGPIRMISSIVGCALAFLLAFVFLLFFLRGDPGRMSGVGVPLHLLAAAGMGASFSALFEASSYIVNSTFDPRYKGYYWIKIVLGLTAGYILAELIHIGPQDGSSIRPHTLALLGGFSGTAVYNILKRMADSIASMAQGDPREALNAQQAIAEARATERASLTKMRQASGLMDVQNLLTLKADPDEIRRKIGELMSDLGVTPTAGSAGSLENGSTSHKAVDPGKNNGARSEDPAAGRGGADQ